MEKKDRSGHHQNILRRTNIHDSDGEWIGVKTEIVIPKIINSDIGFQLMFGFPYPSERPDLTSGISEHTLNQTNYDG